jgi:translation initiation factor IF-3
LRKFYEAKLIKNFKKPDQKSWHIKNEQIQATELRVIDDAGTQLGVLSRTEALQKARDEDKDLILITNHVTPPVVKIIDFKKFLYQEEKKKKEAKKGVKKSTVKDIQLSLFIAEGDRDRLHKKTEEFLNDGFQVRIKLLLRGREMGKQKMAFDLMNVFITSLTDAAIATPPRMQGRVLFAVVVRRKK